MVTSKGKRSKTVAITLHLPVETVELLRDVALAHAMNNVAKGAKGRAGVKAKKLSESISTVIADMIEKHGAELEAEAKTVRGASRR